MKKKCPSCALINFATAERCLRCGVDLTKANDSKSARLFRFLLKSKICRRIGACLAVIVLSIFAFYLSLLLTAKALEPEEAKTIRNSIKILEGKGFTAEVAMLRYLTAYRGNDNWLNASTRLENAYAATNFPFEIMTIYPDFFMYPQDDLERAAILLHEARHLLGADEKAAYEYVWKNRRRLGWTREKYGGSVVWRNVRKQTREIAPEMFVCEMNDYADCTEQD